MGFNVPATGTEIEYISKYDNAIDWRATQEAHGFTLESFNSDPERPGEEAPAHVLTDRMQKCVFLPDRMPTRFHLKVPRSSAINKAMKEEDNTVSAMHRIASSHIVRVENLESSGGGVMLPENVEHKKGGFLAPRYEDAIPSAVLMEIGAYLVDRGDGIDAPLQI